MASINSNIFSFKCSGVDRDLILLQLQKDVKYLAMKTNGVKNIKIDKIPKIAKSSSYKIPNKRNNNSQDCNIF